MAEPPKLTLRVLVKGASTTVYTSWMSGPRSDFAWPRVIEAEAVAAGWPVEVRCTATPAELTKAAWRRWPVDVLAWSPDVIVLDYPRMETVHLFVPRWFERHANSLYARPFPVQTVYRRKLIKPFYRALLRLQQEADRVLPATGTVSMWRLRRGMADLEALIARMRTVATPLILLPEIPPFGKVYEKWFPGANERVAVANEALVDLVRRLDHPDIRFVPLAQLWDPLLAEGGEPCPDGGHFTPELHRGFGQELARVILGWAEDQEHLLVEPRVAPPV